MMNIQKTYTCRCGKKKPLPLRGQASVKCGCGRVANIADGKVQAILDKKR